MNTTSVLLRETLSAEAETMTMAPHLRTGIDLRARRYRVRRTTAMATGLFVALVVGVGGPWALRSGNRSSAEPSAPAAAPVAAAAPAAYDAWSPRGSLSADTSFISAAVATWDADSSELVGGGRHADVRALWAGTYATGRAALLTATDTAGRRRLAVVAGSTRSLHTIRDVRAPASLTHLSLSQFADDAKSGDLAYRDTLVIVMPPATNWVVEWSGDGAEYQRATSSTEDGIAIVDVSTSGPTGHPSIRLIDGSHVVYEGPIGTMS
ncbi:MAG: hypothetical protein ABI912_02310 [Actinomycetota bacterium]